MKAKKIIARSRSKLPAAKPYWEMNAAELAAATKEFDGDLAEGRFSPMSAAARAAWGRAKRRRGRPAVGEGARVISLSIERGLLRETDLLAKQKGLTRAQLVAEALERMLRRRAG